MLMSGLLQNNIEGLREAMDNELIQVYQLLDKRCAG